LKTHDTGAQAAPKEEKWKPIEKTHPRLSANLPLWCCAGREGMMSEQLEEVISDLLAEALVEDFLSNPPREEESVAELAATKG
jgi:hypothetical protein